MGMKTITIYSCDLCGLESDRKDFSDKKQGGYSELSLNGSRHMNGGGASHDTKDYICYLCYDKLIDVIDGIKSSK